MMTQEVVNEALECGENENSPNVMIDFNSDVDHNKFGCDDIKRMHDCDIQHDLNPQNNNDHIN